MRFHGGVELDAGSLAAALYVPDRSRPDWERKNMAYTLPALPYAFDALEPHIDALGHRMRTLPK